MERAEKCGRTYQEQKRGGGGGLPEAAANVTLAIMENSQTERSNGEKLQPNLCESGDSSVTAGAVVAIKINLPKFRASAASVPLGMT